MSEYSAMILNLRNLVGDINDMQIELSDHNMDPMPPSHIGTYEFSKDKLREVARGCNGTCKELTVGEKRAMIMIILISFATII